MFRDLHLEFYCLPYLTHLGCEFSNIFLQITLFILLAQVGRVRSAPGSYSKEPRGKLLNFLVFTKVHLPQKHLKI